MKTVERATLGRVRDIMKTDVVTVTPDTTARELARILEEEGVSGVPVRGPNGSVIGVVSATDLIRLAAEDGGDVTAWELDDDVQPDETENESAAWAYFQDVEPPPRFVDAGATHGPDLDDWTVRSIMTPAPFNVTPDTPVSELARLLLRNRIHRALVIEAGRLAGIVTTVDVLRAVARSSL